MLISVISVLIILWWMLENLCVRLFILSSMISCIMVLFSVLLMLVVWDRMMECWSFFRLVGEICVEVSRLKLVLML